MPSQQIDIIETSSTLRRVTSLFFQKPEPWGIDITDPKAIQCTFYWSVITEVLIHLRDLLEKLKVKGDPITFNDDMVIDGTIQDINDLIKYFRDASTHNHVPHRRTAQGFLFANNVDAAFDFVDDITILMGDQKLYVRRHLVRAFQEVLKKFATYPEFQSNQDYQHAMETAKYLNII